MIKTLLILIASLFLLSGCGSEDSTLSDTDSGTIYTQNNKAITIPISNAGTSITVHTLTVVTLDGNTSSDSADQVITYEWKLIAKPTNSTAILSNTAIVNPKFTTDKTGTYKIELKVNNGYYDSEANVVTIIATNTLPIAVAGTNQKVLPNTLVQLDAKNSNDSDSDALTYKWEIVSKPNSSTAELSKSTVSNPTFNADIVGEYKIALIVNDGIINSISDEVIIIANIQATANAGSNKLIHTGTTVRLDGSACISNNGHPLTYKWHFIHKPTNSTAVLSNASLVNPTFIADKKGSFTVELVVNDSIEDSNISKVTITSNTLPVANAGANQTVYPISTVQLDGNESYDNDNDIITYNWKIASKPNGSLAILSDSKIVNPSFIADIQGIYTLELIVSDNIENSNISQVLVIANAKPTITSSISVSVKENQTSVITITAIDLDNDALTFSLNETDINIFNINSITGVVTFKTAPDFESKNSYNFTANVSDGTNSVSKDITVSILNLNDNTPTITSSTPVSVKENQTSVMTITATDLDNDVLTFSLNETDINIFNINSITGVVTFKTAPDFESKNSYNFTANVSDGTNIVSKDITVSILNITGSYTITSSTYSIDENKILIGLVNVDNSNKDILTYYIIGGDDSDKITIDSNTGELNFINITNFESPSDFNLDNVFDIKVSVNSDEYNVSKNLSIILNNLDYMIFEKDIISTTNQSITSIALGDMDNDNDIDIVTHSVGNDKVYWYENLGLAGYLEHLIYSSDFSTINGIINIKDYNSDGYLDIKTLTKQYLNDGVQNFIITDLPTDEYNLIFYDINSDGNKDKFGSPNVFSGNYSPGSQSNKCGEIYEMTYLQNNGDNNYSQGSIFGHIIAGGQGKNKVYDLNNNGINDILSYTRYCVSFNWFENDGNENFTEHFIGASNIYNYVASDINFDSFLDIITVGEALHIYVNNGNGTFNKTLIDTLSPLGSDVVVYDYNMDGKKDILITNYGDGQIYIYKNIGDEN